MSGERSLNAHTELIRRPTLFELCDQNEIAAGHQIVRPYSLTAILLGTFAFTANGWQGSFTISIKASRVQPISIAAAETQSHDFR